MNNRNEAWREESTIDHEFSKWAVGFSGCDGGNPCGKVWVCGIEYGGGDTPERLSFDEVEVPKYVGKPHFAREEFIKYPYNWKAVKLLAALEDKHPSTYISFYSEQSCFDLDSTCFKLNLYPIGFRNTSHLLWAEWLTKKTGLASKQRYIEWCLHHRFPAIRNWVLKYSPRLVLCTGISYVREFQSAFGSEDDEIMTAEAAGKVIKYFVTNSGKTMVAVIYFLGGRYGLKSDSDILSTGRKLAEILRESSDKR